MFRAAMGHFPVHFLGYSLPYLVDRTVYVTLTEADGTLHPYSLTIHRTESGMDYTVCSDENVR